MTSYVHTEMHAEEEDDYKKKHLLHVAVQLHI